MEPLPHIPRIKNTVTPGMECVVREVFQNAFQAETATWRISKNLSKSCQNVNPDLKEIGAQIQTEIMEHKETFDDLEYAEMKIMQSQGYHLCRDQNMTSNDRAMEIIRLKRHPLYIDLHPNIIEKYTLLQSDDLLPPAHECDTDFRLNKRDRIRMKKRLYRSSDSLLNEIPLSKTTSRVCRFGATTEQKVRKMRIGDRSSMIQTTSQRQSIIKIEYLKTILIAEPEELFFHNFEYNRVYKKNVLIKNVSNSMARYKIERRSSDSKFTILFDTTAVETTKIAPGMHIKLTIVFLCNAIEDPQEFLIINVQSGKTVCIKMHAYRDPPILRALDPLYQVCSLPDKGDMGNCSLSLPSILEEERDLTQLGGNHKGYAGVELDVKCTTNVGGNFECGKCFVGERIVIPKRFINDGGDGKFFIMSEIDWCSMNVDDIMDCNMILIPPFAVWPIYFTLRSGECIEIRTYFYPEAYGMQVDKLYILCDNHTVNPIELIGDGILYDPNFLRFSETIEKTRFPVNENELFSNYHLDMGDIGSGVSAENLFLISNTSGLEMYYRWEKHSVKYSTPSPEGNWEDLPIENLDIEPTKGSFNSKSVTSFRVIAQTEDLQPSEYRGILRLYIEDIPLAAIPKDYDSKIMECSMKRRNCSITVDILVADIEVWIHRTPEQVSSHSDLSEKIGHETIWFGEAEKQNSLNDNYSSSNSITAVESLPIESSMMVDKTSVCGFENVQCNEHYKGMKHPENLWTASLGITNDFETDVAVPRLKFHYESTNTAILVLDRPLYVGIEQAYTLRLRNLVCKPLFYAWGEPLGNNSCRMKVNFHPARGIIPPSTTATIEVICLPMETETIDNFLIPCFIGGRENPIMLGIECTVGTLYVTFLFLPPSNAVLGPCVESMHVEWGKDGHRSALNLNASYIVSQLSTNARNLEQYQNSAINEEQELKNIDLDAGQVVATTAVGPTIEETGNVSLIHLPEAPSTAKQESDKLEHIEVRNKSTDKSKLKYNAGVELEFEKAEESSESRSWEDLLEGIVWTNDKPDEFITLNKPQATVPFYKTVVPPITQALAIEFVSLPLRTVEKRTFVIRNETPAKSTFKIILKRFGPMKICDELNPDSTIDVAYANVMGYKSDSYWEKIKPPGQGIVLLIKPRRGNLAPHESVPIDIYVYGDTWGVYVDEITVAIIGLPDYVFGVCTQVVGSPIAYPILKNGLIGIPKLRFGSLGPRTESVTRKIMIENTSSVILIVNWYSYLINRNQETKSSDRFNIILQMLTPFTNKIANMACGGCTNFSDADISTEIFQQSILNSDEYDSIRSPTIIETESSFTNYYQIETQNQLLCCSESLASTERILSQDKKCKPVENSIETNHQHDNSTEYTIESEITSASPSEQTSDKETQLQFTLTPYYGESDYSVFTISPAEIIIASNERKLLEISLNIANDKLQMENCKNEILGRLIGFIRVAPMHKYKADCYSRNDGTMLMPTEIQLEATIVQPTLSHEITKTDRTFKIYASSMILQFGKQTKIRRMYLFRNNEDEAMFVNGQLTEPFQVLSLSTLKSKIHPLESDGILVPPGQCVEVDVLCSVDRSWIDKAMEMGEYPDAEGLHTDIRKSLIINHVGSCDQVVPLSLRIYSPLLKFSTHKMEFGRVNIGDSKRIDLTIENISSEKRILKIRAKKNNKDFTICPTQGILFLKDRRTLNVVVTFTASEMDKSVDVLEISAATLDYIEECIIEGYGSWDEIYNDIGE